MFKKFLILFFVLFSFESFAIEKKTTFTLDAFNEAQRTGLLIGLGIIVIGSKL